MGGLGSGKSAEKRITEKFVSVDINAASRLLRPQAGSPALLLKVRNSKQVVSLDWTPCTYGGHRPWFKCPRCDRRASRLYRPHPLRVGQPLNFACRDCYRLTYRSCQLCGSPSRQAQHEIVRLRELLGAGGFDLVNTPDRPRYMRQERYWSLVQQLGEAQDAMLQAIKRRRDQLEKLLLET